MQSTLQRAVDSSLPDGRGSEGRRHRSPAFTLIELLVVISILGILAALLMPAVQQVRSAARRSQCQDQLHNLVIGLHAYEATHRLLPPGSLSMGAVFPMQSGWGWGAMLLPFIEQTGLHQRISFEQPSGIGGNGDLLASPLDIWKCPAAIGPESIVVDWDDLPIVTLATGNYCGVEGVLSGMSRTRFNDVTDGLSNTYFVGETRFQQGLPDWPSYTSAWCGKIAYVEDYAPHAIPHLGTADVSRINRGVNFAGAFGSHHEGGANFVLGDAQVQFFSETMSLDVYVALGTPDGGEPYSP